MREVSKTIHIRLMSSRMARVHAGGVPQSLQRFVDKSLQVSCGKRICSLAGHTLIQRIEGLVLCR